jgi:hypothetical protein
MKQSLLYQGTLILINQVEESNNESNGIIEHKYDKPQIRLQDLLSDMNSNEIQEIWEVYYITVTFSTSIPHYIVILKDSTSFCTCMYIINQGMLCWHQYWVLLQSSNAIYHSCWYESIPTETINYIIAAQGNKDYTSKALYYIDQIQTANVYMSNIREKVNIRIDWITYTIYYKISY